VPEVQRAVQDLTKVMDQLLDKLDKVIVWRRNFTVSVAIMVVIFGLAIWNNNRVQNCNQEQVTDRSHVVTQETQTQEELWVEIESLIQHPQAGRKGDDIIARDIDRYRTEEGILLRHPIRSCSWF
jgi:hypothetical protein